MHTLRNYDTDKTFYVSKCLLCAHQIGEIKPMQKYDANSPSSGSSSLVLRILQRELNNLDQTPTKLLQNQFLRRFRIQIVLLAFVRLRDHALNGRLDYVLRHKVARYLWRYVRRFGTLAFEQLQLEQSTAVQAAAGVQLLTVIVRMVIRTASVQRVIVHIVAIYNAKKKHVKRLKARRAQYFHAHKTYRYTCNWPNRQSSLRSIRSSSSGSRNACNCNPCCGDAGPTCLCFCRFSV